MITKWDLDSKVIFCAQRVAPSEVSSDKTGKIPEGLELSEIKAHLR